MEELFIIQNNVDEKQNQPALPICMFLCGFLGFILTKSNMTDKKNALGELYPLITTKKKGSETTFASFTCPSLLNKLNEGKLCNEPEKKTA